jgi:Icc-related predicted phosphoesterase
MLFLITSMRILCASDMHEFHYFPSNIDPSARIKKFADNIINIINKEKIDVYLNTGDISSSLALNFLNKIKTKAFVVLGNHDWNLKFQNEYVKVLNFGLEKYKDYYFLFFGIYQPPNLEETLKKVEKIPSKKLIFVTHLPPYGVLDVAYSGNHTGELGFRKFLEDKKPILHVFGHIHEDSGMEKFKQTLCINSAVEISGIGYIVDLPSLKVTQVDLNKGL